MQHSDMVEYLTGSPFIDDIVATKWNLDQDGMLRVPDGPGLGLSLDMDAIEKHTGREYQPRRVFASS